MKCFFTSSARRTARYEPASRGSAGSSSNYARASGDTRVSTGMP